MVVSYLRRQQLRRLRYAASRAGAAAVALAAALLVAGAGNGTLAVILLLLFGVLALAIRRALRLAARS